MQRRLKRSAPRAQFWLLSTVGALLPVCALGAELHSVHVDRPSERLIVRGIDFDSTTTFELAGVAVPTANVSPNQLDLPFGPEIYSAVQWQGSYRFVVDGTVAVSIYIDAPIEGPSPPPPPPPPGGPDCPCIAGWEASGIPRDNFTWCYYGQDGNQLWMIGVRDSYVISTAFDPTNLFFDPAAPGNSISYCTLENDGGYEVAEPVVNDQQFSDCELWMWQNICI
jgi:hypothetical protein